MSAIASGARETLTDQQALANFAEEPIIPMVAGDVFFVAIIGVTPARSIERAEQLEPAEWVRRVASFQTPFGERMLKVVRKRDDHRYMGVAWTEEGRAFKATRNRWDHKRDRLAAVAGEPGTDR